MKNLTSSSARRWGTLLVLVVGSVAPIGTASAQQARAAASWRQREMAASDRLALAAHERTLLEEAAQWAAVERGLAEQREQQVVIELRLRIERREQARLARIRSEQAWSRLSDLVRVEQRRARWDPDGKRYSSERRVNVRNELGRHALRKAYLVRLRDLIVDEPLLVARVERLFEGEQRQHERSLRRLGVIDTVTP